jgi:hypothetical protein
VVIRPPPASEAIPGPTIGNPVMPILEAVAPVARGPVASMLGVAD